MTNLLLDPATKAAAEKLPSPGFTMVGDMLSNVRPPDWLIKGHLEADSLGLIYGPPKCGKSFLAIDWACCVATGTPWHGHQVKQATVFYLAGEGHNGLARRFMAWGISREIDLSKAPIAVSNSAQPLTDEIATTQVQVAIDTLAERHGPPALIVVDTLARNFGGDENSTQDMNTFVQHLDRIRQRWRATVLVVHHTGKDQSRGARGSVALTGAIDSAFKVERDELGTVLMEATEMKDSEPPGLQAFKLEGVLLPLSDEEGGEVWSCVPRPLDSAYMPPKKGAAGRGKNQTAALRELERLYSDYAERLGGAERPPLVEIAHWRQACIDAGLFKPNRWGEVKDKLAEHGSVILRPPHALLP
ncbi:helicase RepA family protein [Halomonas salifodinae]|uniref:Helicase RepA family protein n=1 Tax=Halomonas salifodinae TaxID=438745 RepID=A0ABW2F1I9_9GAMM